MLACWCAGDECSFEREVEAIRELAYHGMLKKGAIRRSGDPGNHCDGLGALVFRVGRVPLLIRRGRDFWEEDAVLADSDKWRSLPEWQNLLSTTGCGIVLHARRGTSGGTTDQQAHPVEFTVAGKQLWLFHNGTINLRKGTLPAGWTDTMWYARKLEELAEQMHMNGCTPAAIGQLLEEFTRRVERCHYPELDLYEKPCSSLTCLVASTDFLIAYRYFSEHEDYYTLFWWEDGLGKVWFCSENISGQLAPGTRVQELTNSEMVAVERRGVRLSIGTLRKIRA